MSARPFLTPGSEALLPMDTLPPLAVTFAEPLEPGDPPPQAAMNAARLPYPAIFKTSRRDRSRLSGRSVSRNGSSSLRASSARRTFKASRESPIRLLLLHHSDQDVTCRLLPGIAFRPGRECAGSRSYSVASNVQLLRPA